MCRHFALARSDFDPAVRLMRFSLLAPDRVRRNANGARDLFAPSGVRKKMLAETLTGHAAESVSGCAYLGSDGSFLTPLFPSSSVK